MSEPSSSDGLVDKSSKRPRGLNIAGFVCGLAGYGLGLTLLAAAAVVLCHVGLSKAKRHAVPPKTAKRGLAIAGLILGYAHIAIVLGRLAGA